MSFDSLTNDISYIERLNIDLDRGDDVAGNLRAIDERIKAVVLGNASLFKEDSIVTLIEGIHYDAEHLQTRDRTEVHIKVCKFLDFLKGKAHVKDPSEEKPKLDFEHCRMLCLQEPRKILEHLPKARLDADQRLALALLLIDDGKVGNYISLDDLDKFAIEDSQARLQLALSLVKKGDIPPAKLCRDFTENQRFQVVMDLMDHYEGGGHVLAIVSLLKDFSIEDQGLRYEILLKAGKNHPAALDYIYEKFPLKDENQRCQIFLAFAQFYYPPPP